MGPIQLKNYQALVDDAVKKGAKLLAGGYIPSSFSKNAESKRLSKGFFYPPTVLADVPEDALIVQEEIFGPIMCIIKVYSSHPRPYRYTSRHTNRCTHGYNLGYNPTDVNLPLIFQFAIMANTNTHHITPRHTPSSNHHQTIKGEG